MVCLDTSVIVALLRNDRNAIQHLQEGIAINARVSTTIISLCELYNGAYRSNDSQKQFQRIKEIISQMEILNLDEDAARRYGELANSPAIRHGPIGDFDTMIAAIALNAGETLITRNLKHFEKIPGLIVVKW